MKNTAWRKLSKDGNCRSRGFAYVGLPLSVALGKVVINNRDRYTAEQS